MNVKLIYDSALCNIQFSKIISNPEIKIPDRIYNAQGVDAGGGGAGRLYKLPFSVLRKHATDNSDSCMMLAQRLRRWPTVKRPVSTVAGDMTHVHVA